MMEKEMSLIDYTKAIKSRLEYINKNLKEISIDEMEADTFSSIYSNLSSVEVKLKMEAERQKEAVKMTPEIALKCLANINSCSGCPLNKQDKIDCRDEAIGFGALAIQKCMEEDMKIVD